MKDATNQAVYDMRLAVVGTGCCLRTGILLGVWGSSRLGRLSWPALLSPIIHCLTALH